MQGAETHAGCTGPQEPSMHDRSSISQECAAPALAIASASGSCWAAAMTSGSNLVTAVIKSAVKVSPLNQHAQNKYVACFITLSAASCGHHAAIASCILRRAVTACAASNDFDQVSMHLLRRNMQVARQKHATDERGRCELQQTNSLSVMQTATKA